MGGFAVDFLPAVAFAFRLAAFDLLWAEGIAVTYSVVLKALSPAASLDPDRVLAVLELSVCQNRNRLLRQLQFQLPPKSKLMPWPLATFIHLILSV